jgi:hypothetical protein
MVDGALSADFPIPRNSKLTPTQCYKWTDIYMRVVPKFDEYVHTVVNYVQYVYINLGYKPEVTAELEKKIRANLEDILSQWSKYHDKVNQYCWTNRNKSFTKYLARKAESAYRPY